jgi:hypothetical protein
MIIISEWFGIEMFVLTVALTMEFEERVCDTCSRMPSAPKCHRLWLAWLGRWQ